MWPACSRRRRQAFGQCHCRRALEALDRSGDRNGSPLVFPGERGGYRHPPLPPVPMAAGTEGCRHQSATAHLRSPAHVRDVRAPWRHLNLRPLPLHGASLTMIDRHYGHLARDGHEHAIKLLDALNAPWTLVDTVLACLRRFRSPFGLLPPATIELGSARERVTT